MVNIRLLQQTLKYDLILNKVQSNLIQIVAVVVATNLCEYQIQN